MKKLTSIILILFTSITMSAQMNYSKEWKKVDSLFKIMQLQSAERIIDAIYQEALAQNNVTQLVKAQIFRSGSMTPGVMFMGESLTEKIEDILQSIACSPPPATNFFHSIAAGLFWRYYQENQRRFMNRTAMEVTPEDIQTWDLKRLVEQCIVHIDASLYNQEVLQQTAIESFNDVLEKGEDSEKYRPTLFDFLAFRAVDFFDDNVVNLTQPAEPFWVNDPLYFAPAGDFASLNIVTSDSLSFKFRAITLLQRVIAFHLHDSDPIALIDADLRRLDYVYKNSTHLQKEELYLEALLALDARYAHLPASTEALYRVAKVYQQQGESYNPFTKQDIQWKKQEAIELIEKAIKRFPESMGAKNCLTLKEQIEYPEVRLTADEAIVPNQPFLVSITYKNIPQLFFKILPIDFKKALDRQDNNEEALKFYAKILPAHNGTWNLPNTNDYQRHTVEIALPPLPVGYYMVLASSSHDFSKDSFILEKAVWVSNLSYVQQKVVDNTLSVMVLDRQTGKPVSGVSAQEYSREYNYTTRKYKTNFGKTHTSDKEGIINLSVEKNSRNVNLYFTNGKDHYASGEGFSLYSNNLDSEEMFRTTTFFTDRSIYRPGQTVWFKGIVLKWKDNEATVVQGLKQTVALYNPNMEKVSELVVESNEFGSFSGSFSIPSGGLTGRMYIMADNGTVEFRVEEYKRPKFEVNFEPIRDSYRLGEEVTVMGKATAYAGSAVSDAKTTYRVVRQVNYPLWRWWWGPVPTSSTQEIAIGETFTREDGAFDITFTALPDLRASKKESPIFRYTVYATVSDINGETHEAQRVISIGYQSLMVSANLPEKMDVAGQKTVKISAVNLNGTPQAAKGTITIWELRQPNRILQARSWSRPDQFSMTREEFVKKFPYSVYDDEDQVAKWEKSKQVCQISFDTETELTYPLPNIHKWNVGRYIAEIKTEDAFGEEVENSAIFTLFSSTQKSLPGNEPIWFQVLNPSAQPGETVTILMGSAYPNVPAYYEVMGKDKKPIRKSLILNKEQKRIEIPVTENERGNFSVQLFFVHSNRSYNATQTISVPYLNKKLNLEFATFRNKLQPGAEEEWLITIKDKAGDAVAAELLASMYDASLDAFTSHQWYFFPWQNNRVSPAWNVNSAFGSRQGKLLERFPYLNSAFLTHAYDKLMAPKFSFIGFERNYLNEVAVPSMMRANAAGNETRTGYDLIVNTGVLQESEIVTKNFVVGYSVYGDALSPDKQSASGTPQSAPEQSPPTPQIRTNFNETAFFYPHLRTNEKGETVVRFTIPEALTRWKMQGLAWTPELQTGSITKELVTQKELMIFTNTPRFFRENDTLWFSAKLSNISGKALSIKTELQLFDAFTMKPISQKMLLAPALQTSELEAGGNCALLWKMYIPEGLQAVTYRITAISDSFSDGEENVIPVLTNRMLVTESLPLPIRANQTKQYEFTKLLTNKSTTLRNHAYTLEFTSNPAWSAILALPYIMEYPYECIEQTFSRFYANSIATHIVNSDPRIKQIFDLWRNYQPEAFQSNLEKNEELKALLLEETPWVRAAHNESERKQRVAVLFDLNRMSNEMASALRKVEQGQTSNGGFCWFKGGPDNRYITQHIVAGIGHLQKMGISQHIVAGAGHLQKTGTSENGVEGMVLKALNYMDARLIEDFEDVKKEAAKRKADYTKEDHLGYLAIHYLYARSYYMSHPIPDSAKEAFNFYLSQATQYWTKNNNYLKGMLALTLHRCGNQKMAQLIMKSLSETALRSEEMGMYWRNNVAGWWWYQAPIETQALLIEAFNEVCGDMNAVEELKVWLLKQKQTQDWKTTKATAEAIYALLLTGTNLLASDELCKITVGTHTIDPYQLEEGNRPQAGTGYFKTSWKGEEVTPQMGKIKVVNPNPTIAWGAAYWQYFEQLDKITPAETNVSIKKQLFVKSNTQNGPLLKEITTQTPIKVGDKVTVRIEIRADRDMEYVHLKDMRASAFEPINVLSGYRWQGGLGYYESTRDAATNFFISYLPKGTYVFEYDLFATQQGEFSNGITSLQCMYAPEFTTHSEGIRVVVL